MLSCRERGTPSRAGAVNSGGIGGLSDGSCPIHTDAPAVNARERFTMNAGIENGVRTAAFVCPDGQHFLTANSGGRVGPQSGLNPPVFSSKPAADGARFAEDFTIDTPYVTYVITVLDQESEQPPPEASERGGSKGILSPTRPVLTANRDSGSRMSGCCLRHIRRFSTAPKVD